MAYVSDLGKGQRIYLENPDRQTVITVSHHSAGQQQSQQSGFTTGEWIAPPTLFRTPTGVIVQIETAEGRSYLQVQANSIRALSKAPSLEDADVVPMESEEGESTLIQPMQPMEATQPMKPMKSKSPMKPMQPMKPMKMGDMEMQMNPMQMRMGNMEMRMEPSSPRSLESTASSATQRFCTQCGNLVAPEDRFCAKCGHQLKKDQ
jgi:ribosomal protein S27AE